MSNKLSLPVFEGLEPRLLLTTLVGGDVFEYQDANDNIIRISLQGDVIAEFIAGDIDTSGPIDPQDIIIGDLPGTVVSSEIGRTGADILGGVGGADGVELIGPTPVTQPTGFDADNTNFDAIASRDAAIGAGQTFGFNTGTTSYLGADHAFIQLAQINNTSGETDVAAYLQQATLREDVIGNLSATLASVQDFAIDPTTGVGYAINNEAGACHLYTVDLLTGLTTDLGAIRNTTAAADLQVVQAMAFDSTGQLWILTQDYDGNLTADASGLDVNTETPPGKSNLDVALVSVDKTNGQFAAADIHSVLVGGLETMVLYTGMAFQPGTDDVYAIATTIAESTTTNNLHRIANPTGLAAAAPATAVNVGLIENGVIVSLTFAEDISDGSILVGMDHSQTDEDTGATLARLVRVNTNTGTMTPISEAGMVVTIGGIDSYSAAGRPLLYGTGGATLYRGSSVSLATDENGATSIDSVSGASFRPYTGHANDGLLYFTAMATGDSAMCGLYTIDVALGSMSEIQSSLTYVGDIADTDVTSLEWDVTGGGTAVTLYGYRTMDDSGLLITISTATGAGSTFASVTYLDEAVTNITAISLAGDDPAMSFALGEEFMLAVSNNGAESNLLRISNTGGTYVLGPLSDPDHTPDEGPVRGEDLQGMTWNPLLRNPFTGEVGVLLGTDAGTDELVYIDSRARFPSVDVFAIYVSQASVESSISIAVVPALDADPPRDMMPFEGSVGDLRVNPAQGGDMIIVSAEDGTGGVYIGARSEDLSSDVDDEDLRPFLATNFGEALGVRAANVDDLPSDVDNDLSPGIVVAESLLDFFSAAPELVNRLLGQNFDDVQGLAVDMQGNIVVVDTDGVDAGGVVIGADQIATVNADGTANAPVTITSVLDGVPLSGTQGLDYGDVDFTGTETLYAVMNVNDVRPQTNIGNDLGADMSLVGLTVTSGNQIYAVNDNAGTFELYQIDRDATGVTATTLIGAIDATLPVNVLAAMTVGVPGAGPTYTVTEISALEAGPSGNLYVVAAVAFGGTEGTQQVLLEISSATGAGTVVSLLEEGVLVVGNTTKALAFDPDITSPTLYAVIDIAGADTLYSIDTAPANLMQSATAIGVVEIAAVGTDINSGDFSQPGIFVAIDQSGGAGNYRMVRIDLINPDTASVEVTIPSSVDDNLTNYAVDSNGLAYSIYDDNVANNQVWVSPGEVPTLGTLDSATGLFTQIGVVGPGTIVTVNAIAFSPGEGSIPGQQGLYVVAGDTLYEVDPKSGALLSAGDVLTDSAAGTPVEINSMNFDAGGNLFGQDVLNGRLVNINLIGLGSGTILVGGSVATTVGSLRPTVGGIAYDFSEDRFIAVDNSTGAMTLRNESPVESAVLMTLKGITNNVLLDQQMGQILVGGAVTGRVHINGSINKFYAGWLITGNTQGQSQGSSPLADPQVTDNFLVDGDIRDLVVKSSMGTLDDSALNAPVYITSFDMEVLGRVGQVWTMDSFMGALNVQNLEDIVNMDASIFQTEVEYRTNDAEANVAGRMFQQFHLYDTTGTFYNNTFDTAQYVGTVRNTAAGQPDRVVIHGGLFRDAGDDSDFYAVSLLAGQTVTVTLTPSGFFLGTIGVYDPDGRLIATNGSLVDPASAAYMPFQFTADRPGAYRFAITVDEGILSRVGYDITITDVGDIAVGGVIAARNVGDRTGNNIFGYIGNTTQFTVERGDLGAIFAGDRYFSYTGGDVQVDTGNIRSIEAARIGLVQMADSTVTYYLGTGIRVNAPNGSVGLIRATDPENETSWLLLEDCTVGGDIQIVDGAGVVSIPSLNAGGGLGVLRAGRMDCEFYANVINLNTDGVGNDGILDLIDVAEDMGTLNDGGPQISTGPGGNVRYIRVGGHAYQDIMFGGGGEEYTTLVPGQGVQLDDDSGGLINLAPMPSSYNRWTGEAVDSASFDPVDEPFLSYRTYGIRGGGVALIDVISTGRVDISANSNGLGNAVEIGTILVNGPGRAVVRNEDGTLQMEDYASNNYRLDLDVNILGDTDNPIDVFEIIGGNFSTILNETGGEIVNVVATSIGAIKSRADVGLARSVATPTAVNPINVIAGGDAFPYSQQHIGIVSGHIVRIITHGSVGNVIATGSINEIVANYDEVVDHTDGKFNGIAGPILALGADGVGGDINYVQIGEGIAPSGTGDVSYGGLYAEGIVGRVENQGLGSDIRGTINGERGVRQVLLQDGSIINAFIGTIQIEHARVPSEASTSGSPVDQIYLSGLGGIIGSLFRAHSYGEITVEGYGIFNSSISFSTGAMSTVGNTTVAGYGIRDVSFFGGASMGNLTATGRGARTSTLNSPYTVRYSETETWNPVTGQLITRLNDIHQFLGTTMAAPNAVEGLIDTVMAVGGQNLGIVTGYQINNSAFDFANKIGGIQTYPLVAPDTMAIDGLEITTGDIGLFAPLGDVNNLDMNIAGTIRSIYINANLLGGSSITASGPSGNIISIWIVGDMDGSINASGAINGIFIGGDMNGSINAEMVGIGYYALYSLNIGGSFTGTLELNGNVGSIIVGENLGSAIGPVGAALQINGNLTNLYVGTSVAVDGSRMILDVNILGNLGTLYVVGQIDGDIYVGGTMNYLYAYADAVTTGTSLINGNVTVLEDLWGVSILNGSFGDGVAMVTLTAGGDIGSFVITNGNLSANATVTSAFGDIRQFVIYTGDLLGTVSAPNGTIWALYVLGSDLGANSTIVADTLNYLYVQGSVLAGAAITVDKSLSTLYVGQDVLGDIQIGSSRAVTVLGNLQGNLTLGYNYYGTVLYIGGNMGDPAAINPGDMTVSIDADATITVLGNVLAGTFLSVGRDLRYLNVVGDLAGDVFVDGATGTLMAGSVTNSVITAGLDMTYLYVLGNMTNTLVQTGIRRGGDNDFAAVDVDGSGEGRMGKLLNLVVLGTATNSVIAAGGDINYAAITGGMTNSSISSGLVLGGPAIAGVINDAGGFAARLSDAARRNTARSDAGRSLLRGNFSTAAISGVGMVGSDLSAGVDAGADGIFDTGDDNVVSSLTGGNSSFYYVVADMDAASRVVADNGITFDFTVGGVVVPNVTYAIADITPVNPLEPLVGTATLGNPVTINGVTVTITGIGQVDLYDNPGGSDVDSLVISGTNTLTRIDVTGAGTTVGRILTTDDTQFYSLNYEGTLAGDGAAADPDLWLDSPTTFFTLGTLGDAVNGRVGGNVYQMNLGMQGSGDLRIGGGVTFMNLVGSIGDPLLNSLGVAPSADVNVMTTDAAGNTWIFDDVTGNLSQVNLATGAVVAGPFAVNESFSGAALTLTAMDFNGMGILNGVASLYNQSPTTKTGSMSNSSLSLRGMAVDANGRVVAVETSAMVALNGDLGGDFNIQAITVTTTGNMYAVNDNAGVLELYQIDRNASGDVTGFTLIGNIVNDVAVAITHINAMDVDAATGALIIVGSTTGGTNMTMFSINPATGVAIAAGVALTDPGAVNDPITGAALSQSGVTLYVVRDVAGVDTLYAVDAAGAMTEVAGPGNGAIQVGGVAVNIIGMDINVNGRMLAIGSAAGGNQTFRINLADPTMSWALDEAGSVSADATGFASDASGALYTINDPAGVDDTVLRSPGGDRLVEINTTTGVRTVIGTISDIYDNTYHSDVLSLAFDGDVNNPKLYALLGDRDGVGGAYATDNGVAIVQIETADNNADGIVRATHPNNTWQPGVMLDQNDTDTLVGAVNLGGGVVQINTTNPHADWIVGDALQNDVGDGDDWVGRVTNIVNPTTFDITLSKGVFADVLPADGVERNVTDSFNAMSLNAAGTVYAIRRGSGTFVDQDHLVTIDLAAGTVGDTQMLAAGSRVQVGGVGDTEIIGMGFDAAGNVVAYNLDTLNVEAELIGLTAANLATPNASQLITNEAALSFDIDGFALGRSGANYLTYAYETDNVQINLNGDMDYGQFFMNPAAVDTLGSIDVATGVFTQWVGLVQDANGTTLSSPVVDMSFDNAGVLTLNVVTADGRLAEFQMDGRMVFYPQAVGDTLSAGSVINNGHSVVTITTDNPQVNWQLGDYVGNDFGGFDDWFGQITSRTSDTVFQVTLTKGTFAAIDIADGIALGNLLPAISTITSAETGDTLDVTAIDFDDVSGELIGLDARFNQLVTISNFLPLVAGLRAATAQARTENGAVDVSNLAGLTYDPLAATFYSFRDSDDRFVQFRGTTQAALGGIVAGSISYLNITGVPGQPFNGRIVTTGNTFGYVGIAGDFTGSLISGGDIRQYIQRGGDFSGRLLAGGDIFYVAIAGHFLDGGSLDAAGALGTFVVSGANDLGGLVKAQVATTISVGGEGLATADVLIYGLVYSTGFGGGFSGALNFGEATYLAVAGQLGATADIDINGNAASIQLLGGTAAESSLITQGYVSALSVGGQHSGLIGIRRGMGSAALLNINAGLLAVGEKTVYLQVLGDMTDSVVSFGTWIGADGLYNTADDIITGGGVYSAYVGGNFHDSAIVAGVLPSINTASAGTNNLPTDMQAYVGNTTAANYMDINPAEHGGILGSSINLLSVVGQTINPVGATKSVAAAANTIDRTILYTPGQSILTREYIDPIGAPEVVFTEIINDNRGQIVFSEELNTASLVLSQDNNADGVITPGGSDVVGTVLFTDGAGGILNDIVLTYSTQTTDSGRVQSVLTFYRAEGFDGMMVTVHLSGISSLPGPVIYGSSLRSARMDLSCAPTAIILGDDASLPFPFADVANDFISALDASAFDVQLDGERPLIVGNAFNGYGDTDVYRFTANVYEFFSVEYTSNIAGELSMFYQDTQGTLALADDTFELVARYEWPENDDPGNPYTLFEAFELAGTGNYFVLVNPMEIISGESNIYTLEMNRASSDVNLINQLGGFLPAGEEIAYVSNFMGQNNNQAGFNDPRQLVYLDFDGGTATKYDVGPVVVQAFDLGDIEADLAGNETQIIEGGGGVVGIVDNIMAIYGNIAPSYVNEIGGLAAGLNVQRITTLAEWQAVVGDPNGSGFYFTTVDPATWGLDPDTDFTTAFTGNADDTLFGGGLLGRASQIDVAGQSKADNALIFAQNMGGLPVFGSETNRLNQYSIALANIISHELGHTFGLNHQPTDWSPGSWILLPDDPDNDPLTPDDSNQGNGLMAYVSSVDLISSLSEFGTNLTTWQEIPIGDNDTQDMILRWFS